MITTLKKIYLAGNKILLLAKKHESYLLDGIPNNNVFMLLFYKVKKF